ncbi:MAG: pyrroline-5-carboxylate reductase [Mediterranea sp.]|jgi:pyrroline-5-carboxylate reductase|nr:pyrroline-5-carboxylate reductase [Mediterranea sp.]
MKITIIGAGNMGGAIARGLAKSGHQSVTDITVSDPFGEKLHALKAEYPNINISDDNEEAVKGADYVILAVKPWLVGQVLRAIRLKGNQVLVSIASGISFEELAHDVMVREMPMFRVIPNTAISELESMTLIASRNTNKAQNLFVQDIFYEMGRIMFLDEEKLAAATALSSCGIAYVLKYIQAAMQAGIEMGIRPDDAMELVAQSAKGAAALILERHTHPAVEIDKVTTPGGITIKGINELEHAGFTSAIIKAMKESR